jgi:hypothetical protein
MPAAPPPPAPMVPAGRQVEFIQGTEKTILDL